MVRPSQEHRVIGEYAQTVPFFCRQREAPIGRSGGGSGARYVVFAVVTLEFMQSTWFIRVVLNIIATDLKLLNEKSNLEITQFQAAGS